MAQVKKQLTAMPHLLANNQGKLSLKQYKMSPQADALSARIMRFFATQDAEHTLHCLYHIQIFLVEVLPPSTLKTDYTRGLKHMGDYCGIDKSKDPHGEASVLWHLTHIVKTAPERRQPGK